MASMSASLHPPLLLTRKKSNFTTFQKLPFGLIRENHRILSMNLKVKAKGENSGSSTDLGVVGTVQNVWDKSEDRLGLIGLSFAAIVALWASLNLVTTIDKVPVLSTGLELIGILFSTWFTYRYLLFKPDREELYQIVKKSVSDVLGQ